MDQAQRATVFLYGSNPPFGGTRIVCVIQAAGAMLLTKKGHLYIGVTRNHVIPEITSPKHL